MNAHQVSLARAPSDSEDAKRTRRELIFLWFFLVVVLVMSALAAWLLWAKIHQQPI